MKRAALGLALLLGCAEPKKVARIVVEAAACPAVQVRGAGDVFLSSLEKQELSELTVLLNELADRLDARLFDADFDESEPFAALQQWMAVREQAWSASLSLAAKQWGPADGTFCVRVEVSDNSDLPPVWPEPGDAGAPPRVRFVMSILTEGVRLRGPLSANSAARCRQAALKSASPLAMLVQNRVSPSPLPGLADRILRRLPATKEAQTVRAVLSQLGQSSGHVALPGLGRDEWLAVARVGAKSSEVQDTLADCLAGPH